MRKIIFVLALFTGIGLYSCTGQTGVKSIDPKTFSAGIAKSGSQLVDVRTPAEYGDKHLKGAMNADINSTVFEHQLKTLDRNKPLYLYCLSGGRSGRAASWAAENGFKEVYNLEGGILAWNNAGLPTEVGRAPKAAGMSFDDYLAKVKSGLVLVDFNAVWCGPCKMIKPYLESIEKKRRGVVTIMPVDVDQNPAVAKAMNVTGIPLLILYKNGKEVWRKMGVAGEEEMLGAIDSNK
jgi:thioredoxin